VCQANSLPPKFFERLSKNDDNDRKVVIKEQIAAISQWCDPRYKNVVQQFEKRQDIIEELDYIRIMYNKPITASQRIRIRNKIKKMILTDITLTQEQIDFLVSILEYYDCL
jgi:hypothetical protein